MSTLYKSKNKPHNLLIKKAQKFKNPRKGANSLVLSWNVKVKVLKMTKIRTHKFTYRI
jgi:hypothetical protein